MGKDVDYYILSNSTSAVHGQNIVMTDVGKLQTAILNRPVYRYSINTPTSTEDDHDFVGMDITSKAGNLADALGNNIYNVDSLVSEELWMLLIFVPFGMLLSKEDFLS